MNANVQSNTSPSNLVSKAEQRMYNSHELCLFDLHKIKDVIQQFVNNDDMEEKLKSHSSFLLNFLNRIINN